MFGNSKERLFALKINGLEHLYENVVGAEGLSPVKTNVLLLLPDWGQSISAAISVQ